MIKITPISAIDAAFTYQCICELEQQVFDQAQFNVVFNSLLNAPQSHAFIIYNNSTPIGFIHLYTEHQLHHNGKVGEIVEFVLLPEHRGLGAGKKALELIKAIAMQENCVLLELASNMKRKNAHRFYTANGFHQTHFKFTLPLV